MRGATRRIPVFTLSAWNHVFMRDEVEVSSVFLPASCLVCASDGRGGKQEEKNKKTSSLFLWSPSIGSCVSDIWSMWRDGVPAACMKPQLGEITLEMLPVKEANPAPPKGGADLQFFFNPPATFDCPPARRVKSLHDQACCLDVLKTEPSSWKSPRFSGLPVALKKKQPYPS